MLRRFWWWLMGRCPHCGAEVAYGQWNDGPLAGKRICWNPNGCTRG